MRFQIKTQPSYEELQTKLSAQFPQYEVKMRGKQFLVVKKSATCGVNILVRREKMMVNGNFPSMGGQMIFTILMILLGIIIPIIIYFIVFHKKFKAIENEVGDYLKEIYGT